MRTSRGDLELGLELELDRERDLELERELERERDLELARELGLELESCHTASALTAGTGRYNVLTMKTRLVSMGNSRGVRIPKPLIEQVGLGDEVELEVRDGTIIIAPLRAPRTGWAEAAAAASEGLLDPETPTQFDEAEWRW